MPLARSRPITRTTFPLTLSRGTMLIPMGLGRCAVRVAKTPTSGVLASPEGWRREEAASGVMMIPIPRRGTLRRVEGADQARKVSHVEDVRITAKPDQLLVPLPEGASYLGFIFARADQPSDVERALREAHARLHFTIDAEFPVIAPSGMQYNSRHG